MIFNVKGKYKITQEDHIIVEGENLITFYGESFFLNRCINNTLNPMQYIAIGNGRSVPLKRDEKLGNELLRKTAITTANRDEISVDLRCTFTASEIIGVTEIGVANGLSSDPNVNLISHDVFQEIESDNLTNPVGEVTVTYSFQFSTATIRQGWVKVKETYTNLYRIYEPSNIIMVYENTTKNGYVQTYNQSDCNTRSGSYYYNRDMQVLYVHTSNGNHPDSLELIIHSK